MKATSVALVLAFAVAALFCVQDSLAQSGGANWMKFAGCLRNKLGLRSIVNPRIICAAGEMVSQYNTMNRVQCKNCDKYFHCQANYNAVAKCGRSADAKKAAEAISDCREFSQGGTDADSRADQVANRHGRGLNSCSKYLCASNCKYSPGNGSCRKSNC